MTSIDRSTRSVNSTPFWIITAGQYTHWDSAGPGIKDIQDTPVKEFQISDFARYLISPDPIEFEKRLVGCEVHYHQHISNRKRQKIWQILPRQLNRFKKKEPNRTELFMPQDGMRIPRMNDGNLEAHLNRLYGLLRSHDPIYKGLADLDRSNISDVVGICEDLGGNRTWLRLRGSIDDKIEYIGRQIFKNVGVVLDRAYMTQGVFELRGFDFEAIQASSKHRLLKFFKDGQTRVCVLNNDGQCGFWLKDLQLLNYLHLLNQSIQMNPLFKDAFHQFVKGDAHPLKLLFKQDLSIDYSRGKLPTIYRQAIREGQMESQDRQTILGSLNHLQLGVSVHYIPRSESKNDLLCTNLSVMHDFRALESIKNQLPDLYANMKKHASLSEAGNYYLLDAIKGFQDVD